MTTDHESSPIVLESVSRRLRFDIVARWLPGSVGPVTAWALVFVCIDVVVLQAYKEFAGYPATFLMNPTWLISPAFAVLAAIGTSHLYRRYETALELIDVEQRTTNPAQFSQLAPRWVRALLYVLGFVYAGFTVYNLSIGLMLETGGIAEVVGTVIVMPLGYIPLFVEFLTCYLGIMIFLPRRIKDSDFSVHFLDPEGLGGLRPIGELAKLAYYLMVVGLVGFLVFTYGPFVVGQVVETPYPEPGIVVNAAFTLAWFLTITTLAHALFVLHVFLKREKENELSRLDREARALVENPFDIQTMEITDEEAFRDLRERIRYVNQTKEYPTTFAMWSQILIGLVLPKALQMLLAVLK